MNSTDLKSLTPKGEEPMTSPSVKMGDGNGQHSVSGDFAPTPNSGQRQKMRQPQAYDQVIRQNKVTPPSRPTVMGTGEPDKRKR